MGKQYNKVIKRRRRLAYVKRRKAREKAGIVIGRRSSKGDAEKKPAKKAPVKKAKPAPKKVEEAAAPETGAETTATTES